MTKYSFTKVLVSIDRLTREVQQSAIVVSLESMNFTSPALEINFRADLSENDEAILNALVEAHSGLPLPENTVTSVTTTAPKTPDGREIFVANRLPPGYTVYPTGTGDHIANGTYGNGPDMRMDGSDIANGSNVRTFQLLQNWYGIGGKCIWEGATLADSISAALIATASTGFTNVPGDFDKVVVGGPYNMIVPVAPGTGAWSGSLTAYVPNTTILKCTPVPAAGGNGWFDYNSDTNVITPNMNHTGNFNLYDFDCNLFRFANTIWGRKLDGSESSLESTDMVGKLIYAGWKVKFTLTCVTPGVKCGIIIVSGAKRNI